MRTVSFILNYIEAYRDFKHASKRPQQKECMASAFFPVFEVDAQTLHVDHLRGSASTINGWTYDDMLSQSVDSLVCENSIHL
jgi:hypothetical protein